MKSIAAGGYHSCALIGSGRVDCWGSNRYGQTGSGAIRTQSSPLTVPGLTGVSAVASGNVFSCAVRSDDTGPARKISCWGSDSSGQLGVGGIPEPSAHSPVDVNLNGVLPQSNDRIASLVTGDDFACALTRRGNAEFGNAWCWGRSDYGQSGGSALPLPNREQSPVEVIRPTPPMAPLFMRADQANGPTIAAGGNHACVVAGGEAQGQVWCWGRNYYGQLGDGTTTDRSRPRQVPGLTGAARSTRVTVTHAPCSIPARSNAGGGDHPGSSAMAPEPPATFPRRADRRRELPFHRGKPDLRDRR